MQTILNDSTNVNSVQSSFSSPLKKNETSGESLLPAGNLRRCQPPIWWYDDMMVRYDDGISFYCNMGLKHHVAEQFYGQSEDSGDHFACISSAKKSEKKPARSKDFEGECDDAWQELRKKIPDVLCLQFSVLFRFLPILLFPPERLHEVGCKQSFHSALILSLVIISVWCFFFF